MKKEYRTWIWLAILAAAILAHAGLALNPFTLDEATISLAALNADASVGDSALLFTEQVMDFAIFGASDTVARLLPALAGIVLVMLPWFSRDKLGETGAVTLSLVLLLSPLTLAASRRVDSTILSLCAMALLATGMMFKMTSRKKADAVLALGTLLALTGGALVWDIVIAAGLTYIVVRWQRKDLLSKLSFVDLRQPLMYGTLIALALVSFVGFYGGWDGVFGGMAAWWHSWQVKAPPYSPLAIVSFYEPALLLAGVAALIAAILPKMRTSFTWILVLFTVVLVLLLELRPGTNSLAGAVWVLPLGILISQAVQRWFDTCPLDYRRWIVGYIVIALLFWLPAFFALTQHAYGAAMNVDPALFMLIGVVVLLALQLLLALMANLVLPLDWIYRAAFSGVIMFMLLMQVSYTTNLAFVRGASPVELVVNVGGTEDLRGLTATLDTLAVENSQRRDAMPIAIVDDGSMQADNWVPLVQWGLRDFDMAEVVSAVPAGYSGYVITPEQATVSPGLVGRRGMRFTVAMQLSYPVPACTTLYPLECQKLAGWLLYRQPEHPPVQYSIILWAP